MCEATFIRTATGHSPPPERQRSAPCHPLTGAPASCRFIIKSLHKSHVRLRILCLVPGLYIQPMKHLLNSLLALSLLASCATKPRDLERCPPGLPSIRVAQTVECTYPGGQFTLPAGIYQPEAQSSKGIYYVAPERLKTIGIIRDGHERGGLFIAHEGWQWAWVGHPGREAADSEITILGKRGIIMPTHYKFEPYVKYTKVKTRTR